MSVTSIKDKQSVEENEQAAVALVSYIVEEVDKKGLTEPAVLLAMTQVTGMCLASLTEEAAEKLATMYGDEIRRLSKEYREELESA